MLKVKVGKIHDQRDDQMNREILLRRLQRRERPVSKLLKEVIRATVLPNSLTWLDGWDPY